jgi:hypothetical protein
MEINCPKCNYLNVDLGELLPPTVCDDTEFECRNCEHEFMIGWTAEVEIRDDKLPEVDKS